MLYQVLTRVSVQAAWEPFQAMTRDPLQAMTLVQKASAAFAEVSVIQAATAPLLREQVRQIRAGQPTSYDVSPLPSLTSTPRISLAPASIESQRWAIERGPGGDHDVPYHFDGPIIATATLRRWASLMAAAQGEYDASRDTAADETLEDALEAPDETITRVSESTAVRSERII
jgi:hypothetical protein